MMGKRRILFVYGLVGRGGDAIQVQSLINAFREAGHEVAVVGAAPLAPYQFSGGGSRLRGWLRRLPWWCKDLLELLVSLQVAVKALLLIGRTRPDVIVERGMAHGVAGWLLNMLTGIPLVTHWDAPFGVEREFTGTPYLKRISAILLRASASRSHRVIVTSEASRSYYRELGIPSDRLVIVHNGVDLAALQAHAVARPDSPVVIGFAGSMARWHRVDLLLGAFADLRREVGVPVELHLVGAGEGLARAVQMVADLQIQPYVRIFGALPHGEALAAISRFHIGVLPHTLQTGSPMKLFEYAALGVAPVAPDLPNIRGIFPQAETLAVFPALDQEALKDRLKLLVTDAGLRARVAQGAQEWINSRHTWRHAVEGMLAGLP
jgi:glycosyltransferase involved in cell wall biosynthesis